MLSLEKKNGHQWPPRIHSLQHLWPTATHFLERKKTIALGNNKQRVFQMLSLAEKIFIILDNILRLFSI